MDTNISFEYGVSDVFEKVNRAVSRHASFLRYQDGGSAYDALAIHVNDRQTIDDFIADAFRAVLSRFAGDGKYEVSGSAHRLSFYLPDIDEGVLESAEDEIVRYVSLSATASWLVYRAFPEYAKVVSTEAESSLFRIIEFLRTRKYPE